MLADGSGYQGGVAFQEKWDHCIADVRIWYPILLIRLPLFQSQGCGGGSDMKRQVAINRQHSDLVTSGWTFDAVRFVCGFEQAHGGALVTA